jgi:hypothetical protein
MQVWWMVQHVCVLWPKITLPKLLYDVTKSACLANDLVFLINAPLYTFQNLKMECLFDCSGGTGLEWLILFV